VDLEETEVEITLEIRGKEHVDEIRASIIDWCFAVK